MNKEDEQDGWGSMGTEANGVEKVTGVTAFIDTLGSIPDEFKKTIISLSEGEIRNLLIHDNTGIVTPLDKASLIFNDFTVFQVLTNIQNRAHFMSQLVVDRELWEQQERFKEERMVPLDYSNCNIITPENGLSMFSLNSLPPLPPEAMHEWVNRQIRQYKEQGRIEEGKVSDGFHTFDELYEFRKMYNAALFNEWANSIPDEIVGENEYGKYTVKYNPDFDNKIVRYNVHKSWKHFDGELCFGGGWFIVSAMLPAGLITNHYKAEDWDLFKIPETEKALFEFDGHTAQDVLDRLKKL